MVQQFKQYYRTNEAQKQINVERARIQKDNNERLSRIRELETSLGNLRKQLDDPAINDSKKQTLFKEFQTKQQEGVALDRERRELATDPQHELAEMTAIYVARGVTHEVAAVVATQLMAHDALGAHARDELGISETLTAKPLQAALASAASFVVGAALPLAVTVFVAPDSLLDPAIAALVRCLREASAAPVGSFTLRSVITGF